MKQIPTTETPRLLQDEAEGYETQRLSKWFASRIDARETIRRNQMTDQQQCYSIHVRVMDVYGRRVVYPVCDHAKVFAAIAGTTSLTETTLRCIQKLGYEIHVIPQEPLTLDL
jgi:hypothetical protein